MMDEGRQAPELIDLEEAKEVGWSWRNCRSVWFSMAIIPCPWDWRIEFGQDADVYGGIWSAGIGPIFLHMHASIGNSSDENPWRAWFGLSANEAYERAERKGKSK